MKKHKTFYWVDWVREQTILKRICFTLRVSVCMYMCMQCFWRSEESVSSLELEICGRLVRSQAYAGRPALVLCKSKQPVLLTRGPALRLFL